jgi:uncharacterized surface anchored protein
MRHRRFATVLVFASAGSVLLHLNALPPQSPTAPSVARTTAIAPTPVQAAPPSKFEQFTLSGVVLDEKGKPVKGAEVTLVDPETNFKASPASTDKAGKFTFANLTASKYKLQATKGGHQSEAADVSIGAQKATIKNLVLK